MPLSNILTIFLVCLGIFLLNVPFGIWREGLKKFSILWIIAIHGPVPLVIFLRKSAGIEMSWSTFPFLIGSYFLGQFIGSRGRRKWNKSNTTPSEEKTV